MTDTTILYSGILCFGLILTACGLTIWEFHKMSECELSPQAAQKPLGVVSADETRKDRDAIAVQGAALARKSG